MPLYRVTFNLSAAFTRVYRQRPVLRVTRGAYMMRRISAAGEVIEDSEPEREERRRQEKEERKKKKALKPMDHQAAMGREQGAVSASKVSALEVFGLFRLLS
jgi:hypothetical protein